MSLRWLWVLPAVLVGRALRVRLSVAPWGRHWRRRSRGDGTTLLVALGDSLTVGTGSSRPSTTWLSRFVAHVEGTTGEALRVDNRAVYGARVADVVAHQLPLPADAGLVTLCIGSNDAGRTPPADFRRALRGVLEQLPPGSLVGDVPEFQWGPRIAAAAELSQVVRDLVAELPHLALAPVEEQTTGTKILTGLAGDFFHPNDASYRRIAAAFTAAWDESRSAVGAAPSGDSQRDARRSTLA